MPEFAENGIRADLTVSGVQVRSVQTEDLVFELCAEDLDACNAAALGGAHRIELCSALEVGGLTPPDSLVAAAVQTSQQPVHVLLRPTAETFDYDAATFREILSSLERVKQLGVAGVVVGVLKGDRVDGPRTKAVVKAAEPLPVTFHRAFDQIEDRQRALEDIIELGCTRVLTSAGAPDVLAGAHGLAALVKQAADRIAVAAGGGLRMTNAAAVSAISGAAHFHGSLRDPEATAAGRHLTLAERISHVIAILQRARRTGTSS